MDADADNCARLLEMWEVDDKLDGQKPGGMDEVKDGMVREQR